MSRLTGNEAVWWDHSHPHGLGEPRTPVVLLPPTSRNLAYWPDELLAAIAGIDLPVVRLDLRDQGRSVWGQPADMAALVNDVITIHRTLGVGPVHLVGAGLGGLVAQQVAAEHGEIVKTLCAVGSTAWYVDPGLPGSPEEIVAGIWLRRRTESPEETIRTLVRNEQALAGKGHFDEDLMTSAATRWVEHGYNGEDRHRELLVRTPDQRPALKGFRRPALVVHGALDPYLPLAHAESLADALPLAQLVEVEGMGHGLPAGGSGDAAQAIAEFLTTHT